MLCGMQEIVLRMPKGILCKCNVVVMPKEPGRGMNDVMAILGYGAIKKRGSITEKCILDIRN